MNTNDFLEKCNELLRELDSVTLDWYLDRDCREVAESESGSEKCMALIRANLRNLMRERAEKFHKK